MICLWKRTITSRLVTVRTLKIDRNDEVANDNYVAHIVFKNRSETNLSVKSHSKLSNTENGHYRLMLFSSSNLAMYLKTESLSIESSNDIVIEPAQMLIPSIAKAGRPTYQKVPSTYEKTELINVYSDIFRRVRKT